MKRSWMAIALAMLALASAAPECGAADTSVAQQVLERGAQRQAYTFLLFYRDQNPTTAALTKKLQGSLEKLDAEATICEVGVTDPAEQAIIKRFGASRAPLPFALAVAPNGAVTALLSQKATDAQVAAAFVTAGMADCMKAMQDRKLVMVCVHTKPRTSTPAGVQDFQSDPEFKDRVKVISIQATDRAEAPFLEQMSLDPATLKGSTVVFLAPPAVLVGKFTASATKSEMAAALHAAGKCCDDPNCKHNHSHAPQATKAPSAKRK